jgi:hypothetical protein
MPHFLFAFIAFGFVPITFLVSDASLSRNVTVIYRAAVVVFCIIKFILDLKSRSAKNEMLAELLISNYSPAKMGLFVFISIYSLRLVYDVSNDSINKILTKEPQEYLLMWFLVSLLPAFYFLKIHSKSSLRLCLYASCATLMISSVLFILVQESSLLLQQQGRLASEVINPVSVGHIGTSLACLSTFIFFNSHANLNSKYIKFVASLSLILSLYVIYLAASRGPFISFVAISLLSIIGYVRNTSSRKSVFLLISIVVFSVTVAFATGIFNSDSAFSGRVIGLDDGRNIDYTSESNEGRQDLHAIAIALIFKSLPNLIFGFGIEIPNVGYPHNVILEAFLSTGILGGAIFTTLYIYTFIKSSILLLNQNTYEFSWIGILCLQYLINGLLSGNLYQGTMLWYFIFAITEYSNLSTSSKPIAI